MNIRPVMRSPEPPAHPLPAPRLGDARSRPDRISYRLQIIRISALFAPLAAVLFGLAGCASAPGQGDVPTPPPSPMFDELIIPGQRIGPVAIGMAGADLLKALGPPRQSFHSAKATHNHFGNGLWVTVRDTDNKVVGIGTSDPRYRTKDGLRVGATEFEIRAHLGVPPHAEVHTDRLVCYPGLKFVVSEGYARSLGVESAPARGSVTFIEIGLLRGCDSPMRTTE